MNRYFIIGGLLIIGLSSCSKEEGQGGRSSISGIIEGTETSIARSEVIEITTVPGNEINGKDFLLLNTVAGNDNYFVWFNDLANVLGAPLISNRIGVKVDYNSGSSSNISIATSIETAINGITGSPFTVTRSNDILTITCNVKGVVTDADNGVSKLAVDVKTQGKDQLTLQSGFFANEDVFIIYGDEDEIHDDEIKTNYDGTFKFSNLRKGSYRIFAYSKDESSLSEPLTPVFESIEIGGNEDATIGTITIEKKND